MHSSKRSKVKLTNTIEIRTNVDGHNSGRVYFIRAESGAECRHIANDLSTYSEVARRRFQLRTRWERYQDKLKTAYDSNWVQGLVGALILSVSCLDSDAAPYRNHFSQADRNA
jgi:hypothetical protein